MEKVLVIARGLPGSGKNTFSEIITKNICCADDYFMVDGDYVWNPDNLYGAHMWCQHKCGNFMMNGITPVVVANTSTTAKELKPYYELAEEFGYKVFSIVIENRHNGTNVHNVPLETIQKMRTRFDLSL